MAKRRHTRDTVAAGRVHGQAVRETLDSNGPTSCHQGDIQKQTIHRFEVPVAAPSHWWQDDLDLVKGIRARMIIDPADGKIPPLTPQAQQRAADRIEATKNSGRGPADSWIDRSLYD